MAVNLKLNDEYILKYEDISRFSAGEFNFNIENKNLKNIMPNNIFEIVVNSDAHTLNDDIVLVCLISNAIDQIPLNKKIKHLNIPYLPYSRQDRVCNVGESFSLKVIANIFKTCHFDKIICLDNHNNNVVKELFGDVSIKNIIDAKIRCESSFDYVIAPDKGAVERCVKISESLNIPLIIASKNRSKDNSKVNVFLETTHDLTNAKLLVFDDICDGGRTFVELAKAINNIEKTCNLHLLTSHGIYSHGKKELEKYYDSVECINLIKNGEIK